MPARASIKYISGCVVVLFVAFLAGCSASGGGGDDSSSGEGGNELRLSAPGTPDGSNAVRAGRSVPIRVRVTDASGHGRAGMTVTLSTTAGTLSSTTAQTDANGFAEVILTADTQTAGAVVVAEIAGGLRTAAGIDFTAGPPAQLNLVATPASVNIQETATLQAVVFDSDGRRVQGATVSFAVQTNISGATLSAAAGVTDANGQANVTYTAGALGGIDVIQATVANLIDNVSIVVTGPPGPASIELLVSSPQLDSGGTDTVTLTAIVRGSDNNLLAGFVVAFGADSGGIQVVNGTTDAAGSATALLSTAGDKRNRTITVTATTGAFSDTNTVDVTGTNITISGANTLVLNSTTTLALFLRDSDGVGIASQLLTVTSLVGNPLTPANPITDFNGQVSIDVTAQQAGNDTITATALGATATHTLTVSADNFFVTFAGPPGNNTSEVNLGLPGQRLRVHWDRNGIPQSGQNVSIFATRGILTDVANGANTGTAIVVTTNAGGDAFVDITSGNAGSAIITAAAQLTGGPSAELDLEFIATTAASLILQATPTVLGVNAPGSEDERSTLTAIVRDANNNPVKNKTVSFAIILDGSNGQLRSPQATTDSFGRASTEYIAGLNASAQNGVVIDAVVLGTVGCNPTLAIPNGPCDEVMLTVAQQSLRLTLGTGNTIIEPDATRFQFPYTVLVTDANGSPRANITVNLSLFTLRYHKGEFEIVTLPTPHWEHTPNTPPSVENCPNEDFNRDGILEAGEDIDGDGFLTPPPAATVPFSVVTNASGFAPFFVEYPQENATWFDVELEARTNVAGSEASTIVVFTLSGLAADYSNTSADPPGKVSPNGTSGSCSIPD